MEKDLKTIGYDNLLKFGKSLDLFTIMTSLLSYKVVYDVISNSINNLFLQTLGGKYTAQLQKYHTHTPISSFATILKDNTGLKLNVELFKKIPDMIEKIENQEEEESGQPLTALSKPGPQVVVG